MDYGACLQKLYRLKAFNRHNIDNVRKADNALGRPSHAFTSVHVAGTNGKGSVTTKIAKGCEAAGMKTGLFTSPHISCFRERICINGSKISEGAFCAIAAEIFAAAEKMSIPLYFFDVATLAAFVYFAREKVDIAIIETGIGGRLDATNIITPHLSVITSIALDHTDTLGETIEAIALEKAGIIKDGVPVVAGPHVPKEVVAPVAWARKAPWHQVYGDFPTYHEENSAVAALAMELLGLPAQAREVGTRAAPRCRLEKLCIGDIPVVLDVAHNPDGLRHLFRALKEEWPRGCFRVVAGFSKSKEVGACAGVLKEHALAIYPVEASNGWGHPAGDVAVAAGVSQWGRSISEAIAEAIADAQKGGADDIVVVCGSFYIMGEALTVLSLLAEKKVR